MKNYLEGKSSIECRKRYLKINNIKSKVPWTLDEDLKLMIGCRIFGFKNNWAEISTKVFKCTR